MKIASLIVSLIGLAGVSAFFQGEEFGGSSEEILEVQGRNVFMDKHGNINTEAHATLQNLKDSVFKTHADFHSEEFTQKRIEVVNKIGESKLITKDGLSLSVDRRAELRRPKTAGTVTSDKKKIMSDPAPPSGENKQLEIYGFYSVWRWWGDFEPMPSEDPTSTGQFMSQQFFLPFMEWHGFETDADGYHTYVRGTFGNVGYFEGEVINDDGSGSFEAYVTFYEADLGTTDTIYGSAHLHYSIVDVGGPDGLTVYGDRWHRNSEGKISTQEWYGVHGFPIGTFMDEKAASFVFCFKIDPFYELTTRKLHTTDGYVWRDIDSEGRAGLDSFAFLTTGVGVGRGGFLGGYRRKHHTNECHALKKVDPSDPCSVFGRWERGVFKRNLNVAPAANGAVLSGFWHATFGPFQRQQGSSLYSIQNVGHESGLYQFMFGWRCNPTETWSRRVSCFFEVKVMEAMPDNRYHKELLSMNRGKIDSLKVLMQAVY